MSNRLKEFREEFLYRPAREAGRCACISTSFRFKFLYRPAREAGLALKYHNRPLFSFYTDLPVRQVIFGSAALAVHFCFYTDLPVRQVCRGVGLV